MPSHSDKQRRMMAAAYANSLLTFVKGIRGDLPKDTDLQNIIDEIVGEIAALSYKLERFK